jgi:hypothetical protein
MPAKGWDFVEWGGVDAGSLVFNGDGTWSVTMDADKTLTAIFSPAKDHAAILPLVRRNVRP